MPRIIDQVIVWTPEEEQQVTDALKAKGHLGKCGHCGDQAWSMNDGPVWLEIGTLAKPDRGHAHVHLVCKNCGQAKLVSLFYLGLPELSDAFIEHQMKAVKG